MPARLTLTAAEARSYGLPPKPQVCRASSRKPKAASLPKQPIVEIGEGCLFLGLPWPPSVNHYWRHYRGKTVISSEGKAYRKLLAAAFVGRGGKPLAGRLKVDISACPPDRRARDLDNILKALLDALEAAGAFQDDEQIDDLHLTRRKPDADGRGFVCVIVRVIVEGQQ